MKNRNITFTTILLVLGCYAFSQRAQAVSPPPDGGYPNGNTAEGDSALFSLTSGTDNTVTLGSSRAETLRARLHSKVGRAFGSNNVNDQAIAGRAPATGATSVANATGQTRGVHAPIPGYPRYKLIVLGTLGGPGSGNIWLAHNINNRGQMIFLAETDVPDPNCSLQLLDCWVAHTILRQKNGNITVLPFPDAIDPTHNFNVANDLTQNGLLGGFATNGLLDPLTDFPQVRPVIWDRNGANPTDLGTFGGNSGAANWRNEHGDTVGYALNDIPENPDFASVMNGSLPAATQCRAFLWKGSGLQDLGTLGGDDSSAVAINDGGDIYGSSYTNRVANDTTGLPTVHPFLWKNGQIQDLGSLGGTLATPGSFTYGASGFTVMNQSGDAIGTSTLPGDEFWHAFVWHAGKLHDLGTLGGNFSEALAISDAGLIVGRSHFSPDSIYHHAVVWQNGAIRDLGVVDPCKNSTAAAINSAGDTVVGALGICSDNPDDLKNFSAFVWKKGQPMADLNDLVSPPSDLQMWKAVGINDRGEIVADAFLPNGDPRAVLLVPHCGQGFGSSIAEDAENAQTETP